MNAAFAAALLDPARPPPAGLRVPPGADPARRFAVHRNNLVVSLVDALAEAFPVARALVGERFFRAMARARVLADPPRSPILAEYGEGFAGFIAGFAPAAGVAYLADVAALEQLRVRAFNAADAEPVATATLGALAQDPDRLVAARLRLHPAAHWLSSAYPVLSIWSAHQGLDDPAGADLGRVDLARAEVVLVARDRGLAVHCSALPAGAVALLDALRAGQALGDACAAAFAAGGDPQTLFAMLVGRQLVVGIDAS
ncbi:MAG: DUF2063 domain-containing protein [Gammaproteobacteria bacterium]